MRPRLEREDAAFVLIDLARLACKAPQWFKVNIPRARFFKTPPGEFLKASKWELLLEITRMNYATRRRMIKVHQRLFPNAWRFGAYNRQSPPIAFGDYPPWLREFRLPTQSSNPQWILPAAGPHPGPAHTPIPAPTPGFGKSDHRIDCIQK